MMKHIYFSSLLTLLLLFFSLSASAKTAIAEKLGQTQQAWSFSESGSKKISKSGSTVLNIDPLNISGIVVTDQFMALVTDEGNQLEVFTKQGSNWQSAQVITVTPSLDEIDIEAVAWQAPYLYALGSHSAKRKRIKGSLTQKENLKRLQETSPEKARQQLFRIELNSDFSAKDIQVMSLQSLLTEDPILNAFTGLPSKENGIDMEGLAIDEKGRLLVGFRGPVLRGNVTPILRIETKKKRFEVKKSKLLYVDADGRGIRGITEIKDNADDKDGKEFLVLTGAVGDQTLSYQVYVWSGKNALPGSDSKASDFKLLCDLPDSKGKPEGIQFLNRTRSSIEFVIVEDGLINGQPTAYRCKID